jgi:hypothetical protein
MEPQPSHYNIIWAQPTPMFLKSIWIWDAVYGGLKPQLSHYNITWAQPYPNFSKSIPNLHRHNGIRVDPGSICPFTAYQGAKNFIYITK